MLRQAHLTELMDAPGVPAGQLQEALRFIRHVNRWLGGTRAVLGHLQRWHPGHAAPGESPLRILDIATGSADIPEAMLRWACATGRTVHVLALDLHPLTLRIAREWTADSRARAGASTLRFVEADALRLPLADGAVDYATCSMFFHHLPDALVLPALREMLRVSRRGVIVNDLLRSPAAQLAIYLLTLPATEIDRHDARVSVAKAWIRPEVEAWAQAVQAPWLRYHGHLFARFTLAGQKPGGTP